MYKCYIGGIEMPEVPEKMTVKIKGKNRTVTLLNGNEINILKSPGLTEISVPLVFPMFAKNRPDYYLGILEKLKNDKKPTQFLLTRSTPDGVPLFDTNIKVSLENYTINEIASAGLDLYVDAVFLQFREYGTIVIQPPPKTSKSQTVKVSETKPRSTENAPTAKMHKVVKGDTLWGIAKKYYGNGAKYQAIYEANKNIIKNPNLIYVGQVLTIPDSGGGAKSTSANQPSAISTTNAQTSTPGRTHGGGGGSF